jgi:hypothetical protein
MYIATDDCQTAMVSREKNIGQEKKAAGAVKERRS